MENYFTKIYILHEWMEKEIMEDVFNEKTICLNKDEMEKFLDDYSLEEIKNMIDGNRFYTSSIGTVYGYILNKKENQEETEIELYERLNLPIKTIHKLVNAGIRTIYDLIMKSEEEIKNIKDIDSYEIYLIIGGLEELGLCLKGDAYENRIATIDYFAEKLKASRNNHKEEIKSLNEEINVLMQIMRKESKQIEELEEERERINPQKTYRKKRN